MFPAEGNYACQPKAWMDEEMMNKWIDGILQLWKGGNHQANAQFPLAYSCWMKQMQQPSVPSIQTR
jgi:hypothetical protein